MNQRRLQFNFMLEPLTENLVLLLIKNVKSWTLSIIMNIANYSRILLFLETRDKVRTFPSLFFLTIMLKYS